MLHFRAPLLLILLFASLAKCFLPGPVFGISGFTNHHQSQTEWAIGQFLTSHFNLDFGTTDLFTPNKVKQARKTIVEANKAVDSPDEKIYNEKNYGPAHFDDEYFQEGQDRLMMLRSQMITFLRSGNVQQARVFLGRQFHGLQDFYAHSNWIEQDIKRTDLNPNIGTPGASVDSPATVPTCDGFCLNPEDMTVKQAIEYNKTNQCFRDAFSGDQTNSELATGFYNSLKCGNNDKFCQATQSPCSPGQKYACQFNMIEDSQITTGYYLVPGVKRSIKPKGRCSHGGLNDAGSVGIEGINKDSRIQTYSPHWYYHLQAATLAQQATLKYINDLTIDWGDVTVADGTSYPQPALTDRELRILFGLGSGTLAFVIDTTGSMEDIIDAVRESVESIVNSVKGTDEEPTGYVLMAYNDPVGSDLFSSKDADDFIDQLETLFADGGGDCPEPAISAVSLALSVVDDYATVFLFTDAGAKDPENLDGTISQALKKKAKITVFEFQTCSTPDIYQLLAGSTGGVYYSLDDRTVAGSLATIALKQIESDEVPVYGDFPTSSSSSIPTRRRRATGALEVPVDSTMKSISFSASGPGVLTIARPDGTVVKKGDTGVSTYLVGTGYAFITVDKPVTGIWTASRSDPSEMGLSITASSYITFNSFDFVHLVGSHPGWFPIPDPIVPRKTYNVSADLEGNIATVSFQFRDQSSGAVLDSFDLTHFVAEAGYAPEHFWYGKVTVPPCGIFSVYAIGKDSTGAPFQRMYPGVLGQACGNGTRNGTTTVSTNSSMTSYPSTGSSLPSTTRVGNWSMASTGSCKSSGMGTGTGTVTSGPTPVGPTGTVFTGAAAHLKHESLVVAFIVSALLFFAR